MKITGSSAYLISIAVANNVKAKFYDEDLPALEDVSSALFPFRSASANNAHCQQFRELVPALVRRWSRV